MTATLRLTVVALATLVCGLVGLGLSLLTSPFQADPNTTSGGWFFLFLAAAVAVLGVATFRGHFRAWLATCVLTALVVLIPLAFWLSEAAEGLSEAPDELIEFTATSVATTEVSPAFDLSSFAAFAAFAGALGAIVLLLLPATREALARRRPAETR